MNIERKISRREFLIGAGLTIIAAGCKRAEEKLPVVAMEPSIISEPTQLPTERPTDAPTPKPTQTPRPTAVPTPEATPTPELKRILATTITQEYLKSAFAGIGGGEMVEGEKEKMSAVEFGQKYVSDAWGEEVDFRTILFSPEDLITSLKYLVSLGSYRGEEGIFFPGKQGEEVIFPQMGDLSLARLTLKNVPSEADQKSQEYQEWVTPLDFLLRPGTQMTVVGLMEKTRLPEGTIIDKDALGGELNYALVAFTDYLRASEKSGVPRHYLVIIPTLTLANLLEANNYQYDLQTKEITLTGQDGSHTILALNQIEGGELNKEIKRATGLYFVDQIKGELIKDPIVPYPPQREDYKLPRYWEARKGEDEEGNVVIKLFGSDSLDQEPEELVYFAHYVKLSGEEKEWSWGIRMITPTPVPEEAWSPEDRKFYEDITRVFGGKDDWEVQTIIGELERAKTIDPKKSEIATGQHYGCYTGAASIIIAEYYASGDSPQKRNKEMLKLLAQVREMARQSSRFDEKDWKFEAVDSY